jgi:rod shape-determining protein MreC
MPAYTNDTREGGSRRQVVGALVLLVAAVSTAFLPGSSQQQLAALLRSTVLRPFVAMQEGVQFARGRAVDSGALRRQLDSLVAVTTGHLTLADENRRLKSLLELRGRLGVGWIPANVVRPGTSGSESMFLLDVGSEDGVERYAPVITGQGVVGVVRDVYPSHATAMDWTHPDFRVSAMDTLGTSYGIVRSRRGEFREEDRLEFDGAAFQALLEDGTTVVTSNLSGDWPRGVPIGKIEGLAEADAGWRKSYWLRPMVEVGSVTHVLVGVSPERDLYGAWPLGSVVTDGEMALRAQAREDSLQLLRTVLAAPRPLRDSVLAALLLGDLSVMPVMVVPADSAAAAPSSAEGGRGVQPPGVGRPAAGTEGQPRVGQPGGGTQGAPRPDPEAPPAATPVPPQPPGAGTPADTTSRPPAGGGGAPLPMFPPPGESRPVGPGGAPIPRPDTLQDASRLRSAGPGTAVEAFSAQAVRTQEGGAPRR